MLGVKAEGQFWRGSQINFIGAGNYFGAVGVPLGTAFACCVGSEPSLQCGGFRLPGERADCEPEIDTGHLKDNCQRENGGFSIGNSTRQ